MKQATIRDFAGKPLEDCTRLELFNALMRYTADAARAKGYNEGKRKLYYISAEFLIGKLLGNNLINLGLYDAAAAELAGAGLSLAELEEFEAEPSLGNGGLGRLAACFLDSLATLGLPADGIGLAYHCGLFRQCLTGNRQAETPDHWLRWGAESWLRDTGRHYDIDMGGVKLRSTMYEIDVTGYGGRCGRLRLFDADTVDERLIKSGIDFDPRDPARSLTLFLYPDDSTAEGRLLRVYQEYFMCANAARLILEECEARGGSPRELADYAAIQINDTHPSLVIPELIRLLEQRGVGEDEAVDIVTRTCGYTNHTILAEALETWPAEALEQVAPEAMAVIRRLDARAKAVCDDPFTHVIDGEGRVHMANLDIHFSHSVNGVAKLHTEILKHSELAPFYALYPERFNNKTNGITFRRWLTACNPALAALIDDTIGAGWRRDAMALEGLLAHAGDAALLERLAAVKRANKGRFAEWLLGHQGDAVDPETTFDVQAKRLHEYKRQQLNLLWLVRRLLDIRAGALPERPVTAIFGAKAAPAYTVAKDIIHALLCLSRVIAADPAASKWLRVAMIENYNVTAAEKLIPACDLSEQISLASKEASGTGNMKFMLNGAVTLGTMDGANVEIAELVGPDNIYTFGASSGEVIERYRRGDYDPAAWLAADPALAEAVAFLTGPEMRAVGDGESLGRLRRELEGKDWFMTFPDFSDYCAVKARALSDMGDARAWAGKALANIARAGYFSSDRTIGQYNRDIWHL